MTRKWYHYSKAWDLPTVVALSVEENPATYIIEQFKRLNTAESNIVIQSLQENYFSPDPSKNLLPTATAA
jgi:hypothetical protein